MFHRKPKQTEAELEALLQLRLRELKGKIATESLEYQFTEKSFERFLRGRKLVVEDAFNDMMHHVVWRGENRVDEIRPEDFPNEKAKRMAYIHGRDKVGRPVIYGFVQKHDKEDRDLEEMKKMIIYTLQAAVRLSPPNLEQQAIVFDMTGFSMKCMDFELVKLLVEILQVNFPETLGSAYVLKAPFIFWACYEIIKPWLDPSTAAKVHFITPAQLTNYIDREQICQETLHNHASIFGHVPPSGTAGAASRPATDGGDKGDDEKESERSTEEETTPTGIADIELFASPTTDDKSTHGGADNCTTTTGDAESAYFQVAVGSNDCSAGEEGGACAGDGGDDDKGFIDG